MCRRRGLCSDVLSKKPRSMCCRWGEVELRCLSPPTARASWLGHFSPFASWPSSACRLKVTNYTPQRDRGQHFTPPRTPSTTPPSASPSSPTYPTTPGSLTNARRWLHCLRHRPLAGTACRPPALLYTLLLRDTDRQRTHSRQSLIRKRRSGCASRRTALARRGRRAMSIPRRWTCRRST